ncbi:MAG: DUF2029 domain-containing protein [Planctomycetes bacterium]|nr:DUF2029 domain-containing protein [Planctomycetota bacterium]
METKTEEAVVAKRQRIVRGVVIAIVVIVGLFSTLNRQQGDLGVYTQAARRAIAGEEAYVVEAKSFTYPPGQLVPFLPLAALPAAWERVLFYFVNMALLLGSIWMVRRIARAEYAGNGRDGPGWWFWIVLFAICARHLTSPLENQSNDLPILFLMTWTAYARSTQRSTLAGAAAGLATALKATPLLYAPVLVWQRRFGAALSFAVALVALTLLPDLLFPRADGALWVVAWYQTFVSKVGVAEAADADGAWSAWNVLNQSLSGTLYRLSTDGGGASWAWDVSVWAPSAGVLKAVTIAAQASVLLIIAVAVGPPSAGAPGAPDRRMRSLAEVGAVVCGMLLLSPMSSKAHFCVLILPVAYMLLHVFTHGRDALTTLYLAVAFALGSLSSKGIVGLELGNGLLARGSVTWCALACLLGTAHVARRRRRALSAHESAH